MDKEANAAEYKSAEAGCGTPSGNANDICKAEASGKDKVARAELESKYKPAVRTAYAVRMVKADADYGVAREHCDDSVGNVKDVCMKEARAISVTAKDAWACPNLCVNGV